MSDGERKGAAPPEGDDPTEAAEGGDVYADLQLDRVESAEGEPASQADAPFSCLSCGEGIAHEYFTYNERAVCPGCKDQVAQEIASGRGRFSTAFVFGALAAVAGAALYYGVAALTGYEIGLIAIVVGIMVGKAVRMGAGTHDHWFYRALGIGLTYVSITATYVPAVLEGLGEDAPLPIAWVFAIVFSWMTPFFMLREVEIMGVIILAIGLWEGWKYSGVAKLVLEGPFKLVEASTPAAEAS